MLSQTSTGVYAALENRSCCNSSTGEMSLCLQTVIVLFPGPIDKLTLPHRPVVFVEMPERLRLWLATTAAFSRDTSSLRDTPKLCRAARTN